MLIRQRLKNFKNKIYLTANAIFTPDLIVPKHNNILMVLGNESGKSLMAAHNIVTNAGDLYYAQKAAGESPSVTYTTLYLSTVDFSPSIDKTTDSDDLASVISGGSKAVSATYPQTDDADADNTGAGVDIVTWLFEYAKGDFTDASVDAGAIAAAGVTSWGAGASVDPLLSAFDLTPFAKTSNDTLKVFVNHEMLGV